MFSMINELLECFGGGGVECSSNPASCISLRITSKRSLIKKDRPSTSIDKQRLKNNYIYFSRIHFEGVVLDLLAQAL